MIKEGFKIVMTANRNDTAWKGSRTESADMLRNALTRLGLYRERAKLGRFVTLAAAIGARVAAIQLLDIEFLGGQYAMGAKASCRGMQIAFIGRVAAPFAETVPEKAKCSQCQLQRARHQSSP